MFWMIYWSKKPYVKRYLPENPSQPVPNLWDDITRLSTQSKEKIGYPTQKPLALLERIITASSDKGDVVLDPFCGCATACIAAERLNRSWVGIDLSSLAIRLIKTRIKKDIGLFAYNVYERDDIPTRTDIGTLPNYRTHYMGSRKECVMPVVSIFSSGI